MSRDIRLSDVDVPFHDIVDDLDGEFPYANSYTESVWDSEYGTFRFRFRVESDEWATIDDVGDFYGRVESAHPHPYRHGSFVRPDGFDGRARLIRFGRSNDAVWWEPPTDIDDDSIDCLRDAVTELLEFGFVRHSVEVERRCDCCESWTFVGSAGIGLLEPSRTPNSYDIGELLGEALYESPIGEWVTA